MPVFGPVLAVLILGEAIALSQITGAACVFAGIVLFEPDGSGRRRPGKRMSILR